MLPCLHCLLDLVEECSLVFSYGRRYRSGHVVVDVILYQFTQTQWFRNLFGVLKFTRSAQAKVLPDLFFQARVLSFINLVFQSKRARPRKKQRQERQGNKQQAKKGEAKEIKLPCLPCLLDLEEISLVQYSSIDEGTVNNR